MTELILHHEPRSPVSVKICVERGDALRDAKITNIRIP